MKSEQSKGFVIVASKKVAFYYSAMNLIDSILVEYPDAQIALFTEKRFLDERAEDPNIQVFDCEDQGRWNAGASVPESDTAAFDKILKSRQFLETNTPARTTSPSPRGYASQVFLRTS